MAEFIQAEVTSSVDAPLFVREVVLTHASSTRRHDTLYIQDEGHAQRHVLIVPVFILADAVLHSNPSSATDIYQYGSLETY